jgi:hypothetical protein
MEAKELSDSLTEELGISKARTTELLFRVANNFAKYETHSQILKDLVCDHDIETSELVFCSYSVGVMKENPEMIKDLLFLQLVTKLGQRKDFDFFSK